MEKTIVLITGTNSGFGYLATLHLAKQGYFVVATMRDLNKKHLLIEEAKKNNILNNIDVLQLDVTKDQEINEIKNYVQQRYHKIDILINNAGYCCGGMTELLSINDWKYQLETNVLGVVSVTQAFLPMMRERRKGKIINIGSISGRFGFPGLGAYATSKFALSGFSESLRLEILPFNIYVSIIEAGSFQTDIWKKSLSEVQLSEQQDYHGFMKLIFNEANKTAKKAADPNKVVLLIEKISKARNPKLRYQVGSGVKSMIFWKNILPWSLLEKIILVKLNKHN
ncbi:short-chain dehydrogenase [Anaerobacillus alkalilacustris]|uniref:Short-chain dehydrogenase n=1 Tax=Anaerobacillus alkalilacustris TaxID=393763 RepID=A0A1S2LEY9_9BACI|nr:SDR family oxidoreductase [Anaerobacillus alkalilacustris]OIJ11089.1 short-chain dehydrogenase [Anaerobacillus alkalilacustris]